jgi:cytochrome c peroxidase
MRTLKRTSVYIILSLLSLMLILYSFTGENSYFSITQKDVRFTIPKGFPKPFYNFKQNKITPEGFVLGRKLFYDPILSIDSSTSCATCHQRFAAFAHIDHPISHGINGLLGKRNVPALENLVWDNSFMWDGGVNNLEVQPINPITNPFEMNETLAHVILKLQRNKVYTEMFKQAFGTDKITSQQLLKVLTQFLGLMVSSDSRYDRYMRHEDTLSQAESHGLQVFRSHCENCHKEPLFTDNSYRNNGLKPDTSLKDSGRATVTGLESDYMKFKVPSLRNVAITYPYMHDGRFRNLKQVINHYSGGKFYDNNYDPSINRDIGLSENDKSDIIAFLNTLTDETFLHDRRFADPNMAH